MSLYRIIETDNYGRDYPNEKFVNLPFMSRESAEKVAACINEICSGDTADRYWKVVDSDYVLAPGFEP